MPLHSIGWRANDATKRGCWARQLSQFLSSQLPFSFFSSTSSHSRSQHGFCLVLLVPLADLSTLVLCSIRASAWPPFSSFPFLLNEPLSSYLLRPLQHLLIFCVARHLRAARRKKRVFDLFSILAFTLPHTAIALTFFILTLSFFSLCKVKVNLFNFLFHFPIFVLGLINM